MHMGGIRRGQWKRLLLGISGPSLLVSLLVPLLVPALLLMPNVPQDDSNNADKIPDTTIRKRSIPSSKIQCSKNQLTAKFMFDLYFSIRLHPEFLTEHRKCRVANLDFMLTGHYL